MTAHKKRVRAAALFTFFSLAFLGTIISCVSGSVSAEEYFSIGMAYYDLGKFTEAEKWLLRAAAADKTQTASEYNLGRIAFETGRYEEASLHFENILKRDPENVIALQAASYTRIRRGDFLEAESFYQRTLLLVPESSDAGFNYALVLFALEKYENCEAVLLNYPFALDENPNALLLLARAQAAIDKVEAVDSYAKWTAANTANPKVLHEYARVLEKAELYAKALEQYRASLGAISGDLENLKKNEVRFDLARLLLVADPGNAEGIDELNIAVNEGFADIEALETLSLDSRINGEQKSEVEKILESLKNTEKPEPPANAPPLEADF